MPIEGRYAFRFSGFAMNPNGVPHHIVGVGVMNLKSAGALDGEQTSSITALQGFGATQDTRVFTLDGRYNFTGEAGTATITFTDPKQILEGTFTFVTAGPDRFWMISTGANVVDGSGNILAKGDEVVSGEAVRIGEVAANARRSRTR